MPKSDQQILADIADGMNDLDSSQSVADLVHRYIDPTLMAERSMDYGMAIAKDLMALGNLNAGDLAMLLASAYVIGFVSGNQFNQAKQLDTVPEV